MANADSSAKGPGYLSSALAAPVSPAEAAQNIAAIRRMTAQSNTWRDIKALDQAGTRPKPAPARAAARASAPAPKQVAETAQPDETDSN